MIITPKLDEVLSYRGPETHMAVCTELYSDIETPLSMFQRLSENSENAFLLDSAAGDEVMGRYSFFGYDVDTMLIACDNRVVIRMGDEETEVDTTDPLSAIREMASAYRVVPIENASRFQGGMVGYMGFDCVAAIEKVPLAKHPGTDVPEAMMFLVTDICVYDHLTRQLMLISHLPLAGDRTASYERARQRFMSKIDQLMTQPATRQHSASTLHPRCDYPSLEEAISELNIECSRERAEMEAAIDVAKTAIAQGEVFQVVLSQRATAKCEVPPFDVFRALREVSPAPYMFFLRFGDISIIGASPEMLARLEDGDLLLCPIAGTRPRRAIAAEDLEMERELAADEKELAEHRMLVDLGRNDLGRIAQPGSVFVERAERIVRYSHVMHIVSDVRAKLAPDHDAYDVLRACFPAGTVSGAPKIRACELIARLEPDRRGVYAGAVGYIDFRGNMDTCIAIRTLVVNDGKASLQTGAGIVHDSVPSKEVDECWNKARAGLTALALAHRRHKAISNTTMEDQLS